MTRNVTSLLLVACLAMGWGCSKETTMSKPEATTSDPITATPQPRELSVDQVAHLLEASAAIPCDANGDGLRQQYGTLPSAILLDWDRALASQLPANKNTKLIFYCANTRCGASHQMAAKAEKAGYADVNVMPAGIMGWTRAGQPTQAFPRREP